jgi:hypothetical protein
MHADELDEKLVRQLLSEQHSDASVGHRSEHLADITRDAYVRATAGRSRRKRIP